jgi:hypothetical protein
LRTLATGLSGGRDVSDIISRFETAFGIRADNALTPEQEEKIRPILARSIATRMGVTPAPVQPQPQIQSQQAQPQAPTAPNTFGIDPRTEIARLRAGADNLMRYAPVRGAQLAKNLSERADKMEERLNGETPRTQDNFNRTFEENKRQFDEGGIVAHKIGVDALGNDIMGSFNRRTGKYYDAAGREIRAGDGGGLPDAGGGLLAKGVERYDSQLVGEDYFAQFSPEVKSAIKGYMRGDTQPTGNPRLKGFETKVKEWARKYGDDIGSPISDALFSERRKYRTELGSNLAGSAGGQGKAFVQGIEHADALATQLEKLGNWNGLGIPLLAKGANMAREAMSTQQAGIAAEASSIGQTLAGEVGKLFSGSAGGGVHEREETRKRFNTVKSGPELAGALQGTIETMEGGLRALEKRRNDVLGPKNDVEFMTPETEAKIHRIKEVIARLRGEPPPAAGGGSAPGTAMIVNPKTGERMVLSPDGKRWIPAP